MRILGITLPDKKRLEIALTELYGVGRARAHTILDAAKIEHGTKPTTLTAEQENKIREEVEKFVIEGDLKREISGNIKRLKDVKSYRGSRHNKRLPLRGQRTKSNSRTVRGNVRKTMGSGRTKVDKK